MIKLTKKLALAGMLGGLALASSSAFAHVGYSSALYQGAGTYDPLTGVTAATSAYGAAPNFTATVSSNAGYVSGLNPDTLGNTHDIRFRYFILNSASNVSFTINGTANAQVTANANPTLIGATASTLNPAFSLYSGVLPASSHEGVGDIAYVAADTDTAAYLANANDFVSWSPFAAAANGVRGGLAAGVPGNNPGLWGVFDTNGSITTGNNGAWTATSNTAADTHGASYLGGLDTPKIATINYLGISGADAAAGSTFTNSSGGTTAVLNPDGTVDNTVSWSGLLPAGIYTLAIGGANVGDYNQLWTDIFGGGATGIASTATAAGSAVADAYAKDRLARGLSITGFTVTAVPVPGAVWLLGSALAGMGVFGRRKAAKV